MIQTLHVNPHTWGDYLIKEGREGVTLDLVLASRSEA